MRSTRHSASEGIVHHKLNGFVNAPNLLPAIVRRRYGCFFVHVPNLLPAIVLRRYGCFFVHVPNLLPAIVRRRYGCFFRPVPNLLPAIVRRRYAISLFVCFGSDQPWVFPPFDLTISVSFGRLPLDYPQLSTP